VHFTPTSSSWLNMVERFFRDLTTKRLRRGVFTSVQDLELALHDYVRIHNQNPKPFIWTKLPPTFFRRSHAPGKPWINTDLNDALH